MTKFAAAIALIGLSPPLTTIAQDTAGTIAGARVDDGFVSVFNGQNLSGWQGAVDSYEVVEGAIRCKAGKTGMLLTEKQYGDFVVRLEIRIPSGGNNGLVIRSPGHGDPAFTAMCELQVLDNKSPLYNKKKKLDPRQYHGSAYGMAAALRGHLRDAGQWNFQEVTVKGSTIKVELNGTLILDIDLSSVTRYAGNKSHPGKNRTQGFFGFAGHGDPVEFRNVWIKSIK